MRISNHYLFCIWLREVLHKVYTEGFCYLLYLFIPQAEAHIAMCNSLNKVHSYLAHPLFALVQVGMRPSGDFFQQYLPSLYWLLLLKPPEYSLLFVYL